MKIIIPSKLISFSKVTVLMTATAFSSSAIADYYMMEGSPCATSCCGGCGTTEVVYTTTPTRIYVPPSSKVKKVVKKRKVKKVKYYKKKRGSYQMVKYYVFPAFPGAVIVPAPVCKGACGMQYVVGDCVSPSCNSFYVPPEYYTSVSNVGYYQDRATADDF